jgi:hypothetical protein
VARAGVVRLGVRFRVRLRVRLRGRFRVGFLLRIFLGTVMRAMPWSIMS